MTIRSTSSVRQVGLALSISLLLGACGPSGSHETLDAMPDEGSGSTDDLTPA